MEYSDDLKNLVLSLLTKKPEDRIGYTRDGEEILEHAAFRQEKYNNGDGKTFLEQVKADLYEAKLLPDVYNFNKDFNSQDNLKKINKSFECFTTEELKKIEDNPKAFNDKCFGEQCQD